MATKQIKKAKIIVEGDEGWGRIYADNYTDGVLNYLDYEFNSKQNALEYLSLLRTLPVYEEKTTTKLVKIDI